MDESLREYESAVLRAYYAELEVKGLTAALERILEEVMSHRIAGHRVQQALQFVVHACQGTLKGTTTTSEGYFPKMLLEMIRIYTGEDFEIPERATPEASASETPAEVEA